MSVDLRLGRALGPQPGGAVALVLGRTGSGGGGPPDPDPIPDPRAGALRIAVSAPWRAATGLPAQALRAPWATSGHLGGTWVAPWAPTASLRALTTAPWARTLSLAPVQFQAPWGSTQALQSSTRAPWGSTQALASTLTSPWRTGAAATAGVRAPWQAGRNTPVVIRAPWQAGKAARVLAAGGAAPGRGVLSWVKAPWQIGSLVESIGGPLVPLTSPPPAPCWVPEPGGAVELVLRNALSGLANLVLACRRIAIKFVPVRRVYMVTNVTTLVRVSDGSAIPCYGMSMSLDVDSWAWGFSASIKPELLSLIEPSSEGEPVELAASVNGTEFRVLVESVAREWTFGQKSLRVQGRGKTAVLDAPYSALQVFSEVDALTSQQLLDQALPSGWTATWGLTAWLVPGGVWSHQGTPITAALAIAAAGGGYLLPHASASSFSVLPRYPSAPWDWGGVTPDLELPASVATREGIEWIERARYNRVYVSGTSAGVLGRVTRTGTAGDVLAQMVTDPLITHVDAARQRGLPVLAEGGRKAVVTLRLPVLPETGVVRPGQFVRYVEGATTRIGLVRSVSLDVAMPEVWQTIKVETHVN